MPRFSQKSEASRLLALENGTAPFRPMLANFLRFVRISTEFHFQRGIRLIHFARWVGARWDGELDKTQLAPLLNDLLQ